MAFTVTGRVIADNDTTSSTTITSGSFTPTASSLILVAGHGYEDSPSSSNPVIQTPTDTDTHSWTLVGKVDGASSPQWDSSGYVQNGGMFRADEDASPASITFTWDSSASAGETYWYSVGAIDVTGHDTVSPIVQTATNSSTLGGGNSENGSVTLSSTPTTGNLVIAQFGAGADSAGGFSSPTIGSGPAKAMTEVHNVNNSLCQHGVWYRIWDGTESNNVITCSDLGQSVGHFVAVAVEIALASAATASLPPVRHPRTATRANLIR